MSDVYKDRHIIIALLKTPSWYYRQYKNTTVVPTELTGVGKSDSQNKGSPKYV